MYTESPSPFELVGLKIFLSYDNLQIFFFKNYDRKEISKCYSNHKNTSTKNDTQHLCLSLSFMFKFISKFSIHEPT